MELYQEKKGSELFFLQKVTANIGMKISKSLGCCLNLCYRCIDLIKKFSS